MISDAIEGVIEAFWKIIIGLVGSIFKLVNSAYRIFLALAEADIFENAEFDIITKNMYEILSIVMLFALAYGILVKIVDPDNSKSGVDGKKILQKLVMAIVLLALIPSIFSFMFGLQKAILESNVLNSIFTGSSNVGAENIKNAGNVMAVNSFKPFFTPNVNNDTNPEDARGIIKNHTEYGVTLENQESYGCKYEECTLAEVDSFAEKTGDFGFYQAFALNIHEGEVDFQWLIALVVGGFLVYAMISFCFDMALRVCKLAFFQIIAPIAIFCNVIPKMEDVFKKWLSNTTKTFISVFTRIVVMNFGVYLISIIVNNVDLGLDSAGNWFLNLIAKCFLILGIVMFMRQAPKLLSDLFGFGDGDMKLGLRDKLKASGAFTAGAAIGAGTTGLVRNTTNAFQQFRKAPKEKKFSAAVKGFGSAAAGAASGLTKGAWYAKGAGSGKDMKNAATQAANKTVENRMKREAYKAAHPGFMGVPAGHVQDAFVNVKDWAGVSSGYEDLKKEQDVYVQGMGFQKKLFDLAADNEYVLAFEGQKKKAQEKEINESNYTFETGKDKDGKEASGYKASDGYIYSTKNQAMAVDIERKSADIKMYDNLIKMAKLKTINEKLGTDKRYDAVAQEFEMFKKQHADIDLINNMGGIQSLDENQKKVLNDAFANMDPSSVKTAYDTLVNGGKTIDKNGNKVDVAKVNFMANNEEFKKENGRVTEEISRKLREESAKKDK